MSTFSALPPGGIDPSGADLDDGFDPDLAPVEETTSLAALEAEIAKEVSGEPVTLAVGSTRPGWSVRYAVGMTYDQLQAWTKRCRDRNALGGLNRLKLGALILANQCEAILKEGKRVAVDGEGVSGDITFANPDFRRLLGAGTSSDAVLKFYASDGMVLAHAQEVVVAAGFEAEVDRVDPTSG
jgi:hypothetical protein